MKRNGHTATADARVARPIATAGEVFNDGVMIELIAGANPEHPQLMLWDGSKEIVAPVVAYNGQLYEPARIDRSILEQMTLPTCCWPHGTTREFLDYFGLKKLEDLPPLAELKDGANRYGSQPCCHMSIT